MPALPPVVEHDPKAVITSVLWHAVAKAGDKLKDQKRREVLPAGARIPVALRVEGRINSASVAAAINGHLLVSHDGTCSSKEKPDSAEAVCHLLQHVPKTRRKAALVDLTAKLARGGACNAVELDACQAALDEATKTVSKPKSGAISFEFDD